MFQVISFAKYIIAGLLIIALCSFLMAIYVNYFSNAIDNTNSYTPDKCIITYINLTQVDYDCWSDSATVSVVQIPCILVLVNTTVKTDLIFYRNIEEKKMNKKYQTQTCSFMPTACNLDSNYLNRIINESIQYLFPPIDYQFDCYYSNKPENMDTLLILPDKTGYYGSIIILAIGELLGLITCLYGWIGIKISKSKSKYFDFLRELARSDSNYEFVNQVKKVLNETHIKAEDVFNGDMDIHLTTDDDNQELDRQNSFRDDLQTDKTSEISVSLSRRNSRRTSNSTGGSSTNSRHKFPQDSKRPALAKLKLGNSQYQVGRIEYRVPSSLRLSRHSIDSSSSSINNTPSPNSNNPANSTEIDSKKPNVKFTISETSAYIPTDSHISTEENLSTTESIQQVEENDGNKAQSKVSTTNDDKELENENNACVRTTSGGFDINQVKFFVKTDEE